MEVSQKDTEEKINSENIAVNYLTECFFKVKDSLSRCGNIIYDINSKKETEKILSSFFYPKVKQESFEGE